MTATPTKTPPSIPESPARRNWLAIVVVMTLLVAGAGVIGWWFGSAGDDIEVPAIVDEFADAMMADDAEALAALHTADGVWEDRAIPRTGTTRSVIGSLVGSGMAYIDDLEMEIESVVVGEDVVITEWTWSGTSSNASRSTTDKTPFSAHVVTIFEMENDLIAKTILHYDVDELWN